MSAAGYGRLRALIVEDNPHMRALLKTLLHALGVKQVHEAPEGEAGFKLLREVNPDFILTDLSMKPMDGLDFTRQVRNSQDSPNQHIPIIMVTGHTERLHIMAARDAGVTEILAKPITVQNLMLRIAEVVDKPRPFVRCEGYFGPNRRRRTMENYTGPWRRHDDAQKAVVAV
ncbi:MAG: response regulator [Rhizomicrobium sp.]